MVAFLLIIVLLFTACVSINNKNNTKNKEQTNIIETTKLSVDLHNIEKLLLSECKILKEVSLNIIGLDDGMFLGLGYGPSGDGYRKKAIYKFNSKGDFKEKIEKDFYTYANIKKSSLDNKTYYYIQANQEQSKVQLMRVKYDEFSDKKLAEFDYEEVLLLTPFIFVNQDDLYYLNINDNSLYRKSFSGSVDAKLLDDAGRIEDMLFYKNTAYIVLDNKCVKLNLESNTIETIIESEILGADEKNIYYINNKNEICIYNITNLNTIIKGELEKNISVKEYYLDLKNNKLYFTDVEADKLRLYEYNFKNGETLLRIQSKYGEDNSSKLYLKGEWVVFVSYPDTIYYWNSDKSDIVNEVSTKNLQYRGQYGLETDMDYLLYYFEDNEKIGLLDMVHDKNYEINVSALTSEIKRPISVWYFDQNTLYGQDICDWDLGQNDADVFYKIDLNNL